MPLAVRQRPCFGVGLLVSVVVALACENTSKRSAELAKQHAVDLAKTVETDVQEIRVGLPRGAQHLEALYRAERLPQDDLPAVREALERARNKVQDLRVAKSTFFALVDREGTVLRNDQDQDLMAGKPTFPAFPQLRAALGGKYIETRGSMPEAAGVDGRADGQWVAAQPVSVGGEVKGLYVTGWSWAAYAYRLENSIRSKVRSEIGEKGKLPLIYVYVVVGKAIHGAPVSPDVNAKAIGDLDPLGKASNAQPYSAELEITGRGFGLGFQRTPPLGADTGVAVLRSET
jgi:hypothetical protein